MMLKLFLVCFEFWWFLSWCSLPVFLVFVCTCLSPVFIFSVSSFILKVLFCLPLCDLLDMIDMCLLVCPNLVCLVFSILLVYLIPRARFFFHQIIACVLFLSDSSVCFFHCLVSGPILDFCLCPVWICLLDLTGFLVLIPACLLYCGFCHFPNEYLKIVPFVFCLVRSQGFLASLMSCGNSWPMWYYYEKWLLQY